MFWNKNRETKFDKPNKQKKVIDKIKWKLSANEKIYYIQIGLFVINH